MKWGRICSLRAVISLRRASSSFSYWSILRRVIWSIMWLKVSFTWVNSALR